MPLFSCFQLRNLMFLDHLINCTNYEIMDFLSSFYILHLHARYLHCGLPYFHSLLRCNCFSFSCVNNFTTFSSSTLDYSLNAYVISRFDNYSGYKPFNSGSHSQKLENPNLLLHCLKNGSSRFIDCFGSFQI